MLGGWRLLEASFLHRGTRLGFGGMADPGRDVTDHRSPQTVKKSPGLRPRYPSSAPGHRFRKVTLTKPTFCHSCSDFVWGLAGFLCEGKAALSRAGHLHAESTRPHDSQQSHPRAHPSPFTVVQTRTFANARAHTPVMNFQEITYRH